MLPIKMPRIDIGETYLILGKRSMGKSVLARSLIRSNPVSTLPVITAVITDNEYDVDPYKSLTPYVFYTPDNASKIELFLHQIQHNPDLRDNYQKLVVYEIGCKMNVEMADLLVKRSRELNITPIFISQYLSPELEKISPWITRGFIFKTVTLKNTPNCMGFFNGVTMSITPYTMNSLIEELDYKTHEFLNIRINRETKRISEFYKSTCRNTDSFPPKCCSVITKIMNFIIENPSNTTNKSTIPKIAGTTSSLLPKNIRITNPFDIHTLETIKTIDRTITTLNEMREKLVEILPISPGSTSTLQ